MYNFDDYKTLIELYPDVNSFTDAVSSNFGTNYDDVTFDATMHNTFLTFISKIGKGIYNYYKRDKISYLDKDVFIERLVFDLSENLNYYFQRKGIDFMLGSNVDDGKYILSSTMTSKSKEKGVSGSSVTQSTASTPTGVSPSGTGNNSRIKITSGDAGENAEFTSDAYANKYTNFQGKTNGLHDNNISRDSDIVRNGNYQQAIELFNQLPKSYLEEIVKDVSKHFIYEY